MTTTSADSRRSDGASQVIRPRSYGAAFGPRLSLGRSITAGHPRKGSRDERLVGNGSDGYRGDADRQGLVLASDVPSVRIAPLVQCPYARRFGSMVPPSWPWHLTRSSASSSAKPGYGSGRPWNASTKSTSAW